MTTAKRRKSESDHCVMRNGHPFCLNCGESYVMSLPAPIPVVNGILNGFIATHANCEKTWTEPVAEQSDSETDRQTFWLQHGERGISSEKIFATLSGQKIFKERPWSTHPSDPSDFNRCHKLLETIPEWRPRMVEMKSVSPVWSALVDNWDRLTEMLLAQKRGAGSSDMYDFMKELGC